MKFARFCKKSSIVLFILELIWLICILPNEIYAIGMIITLSAGVVCIFVYGLGEVVENLQYIRTMLAEQQELREEKYQK